MWPHTFGAWAQRLYEEGDAHAAARQAARNWGASTARANELAEEAVQHCLMQAMRHRETPGYFESYEHFRNWVRRCAVNYIHDHFRRERRGRRGLEDPDAVSTPEPTMDKETAALIQQCWESLSEHERELLTRHFLEGQTYGEMAEELLPPDGRSASARAQDIRRQTLEARARLWQCLIINGVDPQSLGFQE